MMLTNRSRNNRFRNRNSNKQAPNVLTQLQKQTNLLEALVETNKEEQLRPIPAVPDVPRLRIKRDKVYTFAQTIAKTAFTTSLSLESDQSLVFALSDLANAADFDSIFDCYRIIQITVQWIPLTPNSVAGVFYTAIDYDDGNTPSISALQQYDTMQVVPLNQFHERTFKPRMAVGAYSGSFTSYAQLHDQWIDCASPSVQHYGLKAASPIAATATSTMTPVCTYIIQFKNVR
jgi:hypothetical protein